MTMKKDLIHSILAATVLSVVSIFVSHTALAASSVGPDNIRIFLDANTVHNHGYTVQKPDGKMRVGIFPTVLPSEAMVTLKTAENQNLPTPDGLTRVSPILEYDILTDPIVIFQKDVILELKFDSTNFYTKRLYFWDSINVKWRPIPSYSNYTEHWTRGFVHLPYSRVAIFEETTSIEGGASWYRSSSYSYGAASNDYPIGSKVWVLNLENGRSTTVTIKSTGPWAHGRVIDLTTDAFADLAPLWTGTAKVHIEPVGGQVLGATEPPAPTKPSKDEPAVVGKSAIIWDPTQNRVLFGKNENTARSIASISKLMTAIIVREELSKQGKTIENAGSMTITDDDNASCVCLNVHAGDHVTVKDLWYASLTGSANNATKALSRAAGLSKAAFVQRMNDRAKSLGMATAHFNEPTGLDPANKASAADVAKLVAYALGSPSIRGAVQLHSYTYSVNGVPQNTINNPTHIGSSVLANQGNFLGGKTGFIYEAGYCLGSLFRAANGREYVAVTLASNSVVNRNNDILQMMYWGWGR